MSIAAGASATSAKTVAGAENHGHKARSSASGQADALGGAGFLALLMSMDPETDLGTDSGGATDQAAGLAPQALMPEPTPASWLPLPSPQDAMAQNLQQDLARQLAQVGVGNVGAMNQTTGLAHPMRPSDPAQGLILQLSKSQVALTQNLPPNLTMLLAQSEVGGMGGMGGEGATDQIAGLALPPASRADTAPGVIMQLPNVPLSLTPSPQPSLTAPLAQVAAGGAGVVDPLAGLAPQTEMPDPLPAPTALPSNPPQVMDQSLRQALATGADKPERAIEQAVFSIGQGQEGREKKADSLLGQMESLVPLRPTRGKGAEQPARAGSSLLGSRLSSSMEAAPRDPVILGALMNSGVGEGIVRQVDRSTASPSALSGAYGSDGVWGQQAPFAGTGADLSAAMPDPSQSSLESMVADTVSYWVAQGVQNAELKLDGLGPDPVDVSISLKGDEAQIDFRTDQPEIRQVLEGAAAHLKELLAKEGLVLSGVSVGSSSQQGAGAQEQRHRQGARQADIARVEVAPTEPRPRAIQSLAGAVDIFV